MIDDELQGNYETFRDCVSGPVVQRLLSRPAKPVKKKAATNRKNGTKSVIHTEQEVGNGAEDLTDFVDV